MNQKGKAAIIILSILLILSLAGAAVGLYAFYQERLRADALETALESLKAEKRIAEAELKEAKKIADELSAQLRLTRSKMQELSKELAQAKNEKQQLSSRVEQLQSELKQQDKLKDGWSDKQAEAQKRVRELQVLIQSLEAKRDSLESQLSELNARQAGVPLGKIVVGQKQAAQEDAPAALPAEAGPGALQGKVLTINKEYNFMAINLGSQHGLRLGQAFLVSLGNTDIGKIKIEKVQEEMAACGFVSDEARYKIRQGDTITLRQTTLKPEELIRQSPAEAVGPEPEPLAGLSEPEAAVEGRVLVVNKDYDFVVVNLGSQNYIREGDVFSVYHNDKYIGNIRVDKARKIISTCLFASSDIKDRIREGDKVVRR